jgi:hypothetical protein
LKIVMDQLNEWFGQMHARFPRRRDEKDVTKLPDPKFDSCQIIARFHVDDLGQVATRLLNQGCRVANICELRMGVVRWVCSSECDQVVVAR